MPPPPPRRRGPGKWKRPRRKVCQFCVDKAKAINYKSAARLRKYLTERGKMVPRRTSGTCSSHQRMLSTAIKRARHMALMIFVAE
ncbi:MAG: 30S ribosomal protein S18 [Armatimonadetes bacterium]|jgi:small subunit ribosomal protein S18|nr:30S ribosomal protein S18 [Armatimonadota bacterium]